MGHESNSTQIVYVDDRSFAAPTVQKLRNVWTSWQEHTAALGFKENISKTQAFARSAKGRRALLAHPDFAPYVTDDFTVLGVSFRPGNTRPSDKEKSKFQKAEAAAKRARMAPVVAFKRQFMATTAAASKAIYGSQALWSLASAGCLDMGWTLSLCVVKLQSWLLLDLLETLKESWQIGPAKAVWVVELDVSWNLLVLLSCLPSSGNILSCFRILLFQLKVSTLGQAMNYVMTLEKRGDGAFGIIWPRGPLVVTLLWSVICSFLANDLRLFRRNAANQSQLTFRQ